ncbi:hypothetical protein EV426DRAFT_702105 [Tirmania nivea]|nr:hypothetical protein EV426DRAFT_702105 [Tirmania nivea]
MRPYCSTCGDDEPSGGIQIGIPDYDTDKLANSITESLNNSLNSTSHGLGRSSTAVKNILRAKEIVAMMLHICGYDGPDDSDSEIASFLHFAHKHTNGLFRSFLHLKLPHYKPPWSSTTRPTPKRNISLGLLISNKAPQTASIPPTPAHIAILDLLSDESRKQLVLAPNSHPRMCIADAISLLNYLEWNDPWYVCEAFYWGSPAEPDKATQLGEQRVRTLAYVIRWLVGLGPYQDADVEMLEDRRSLWERLKWLRGLNEKDLARFQKGQVGWQGFKWLVALKEQEAELAMTAQKVTGA